MAIVQVPQPPPVGGPAPQRQAPPVNIQQILGQLSTTPPAGPIPITPYAPANVGPLAMPGAGLAGAQNVPPPWTGPPPKQPQFGQPSIGSLMSPNLGMGGIATGGGRGEAHNVAPNTYAAQVFNKLLQQQGMPPIMQQPINIPQQQPLQQPYRPQALQSLIPRAPAAPTTAPRLTVPGQTNPLTGRPMTYQLGAGGGGNR